VVQIAMSRRKVTVVALFLLSACGGEPPPAVPQPDHEDLPRVLARVEAILHHIRAELGADAVGDDPVAVLGAKGFRLRAANECSYAEKIIGPTTEEQRAAAYAFHTLFTPYVVTDAGVLLMGAVPDDREDLDAHLIHGLVEGELARRFDLGAFRRAPATVEEVQVRTAAFDALVRHVGRKVARRAEIEPAYGRATRILIRGIGPDEVDDGMSYWIYAALANERFCRAAADRYVTRLVERQSLDEAGARLFARPPATWGTLFAPDGRPVETPGRDIRKAVRHALAKELVCGLATTPIVPPQVEALLFLTEAEKRTAAADAFLHGFAFSAKGTEEEIADSVRVRILVAAHPEGAEAIVSGWTDTIRRIDDRWKSAVDPLDPLRSVRSREVDGGLLFERTLDGGYWSRWERPEQVLLREGAVVVEVRCDRLWELDTDAEALGRRIRAAIRRTGTEPDQPDIDTLRALTEDPDRDVRRAAYRELIRRGLLTAKRRAIAAADPFWEIRWLAVLDRIRDESVKKDERAKLLVPLLADPDPRVRMRACRRSDDLVPGGHAIPWSALKPLLSDASAAVRAAAYPCFRYYRMPYAVRDGSLTVEEFRFRDLEEGEGPPPEVEAALLAGVRDPDAEVRMHALTDLEALGPHHPKLAGLIRRALTDDVRTVREVTLYSLSFDLPVPDGLVDVIEPFLDDEDEMVRENAIGALGRAGPLPESTLARLVDLTTDEDPAIRTEAAEALGDHGVKSEAVVAALMRGIEDEVKEVRMKSRMALRELGIKPPKPRKR